MRETSYQEVGVKPIRKRVSRTRKPPAIVVEREEFMARPAHWAGLASQTQIVKVKNRQGAVVIMFGGRL